MLRAWEGLEVLCVFYLWATSVLGDEFMDIIAKIGVLFWFILVFFSYLVNLSLYMHGSESSVFSPNINLALISSICHCDGS